MDLNSIYEEALERLCLVAVINVRLSMWHEVLPSTMDTSKIIAGTEHSVFPVVGVFDDDGEIGAMWCCGEWKRWDGGILSWKEGLDE